MLELPPEVRKGRVRMEMTTNSKIKKIEDECTQICKESAQVWIELTGDPKMKAIEAKLREVHEKEHEAT
jgi:hypothetical protein